MRSVLRTHIDREKTPCVKMEAEIGGQPGGKEHQGSLAAPRSYKKAGNGFSLGVSRSNSICKHLDFRLLASGTV